MKEHPHKSNERRHSGRHTQEVELPNGIASFADFETASQSGPADARSGTAFSSTPRFRDAC